MYKKHYMMHLQYIKYIYSYSMHFRVSLVGFCIYTSKETTSMSHLLCHNPSLSLKWKSWC